MLRVILTVGLIYVPVTVVALSRRQQAIARNLDRRVPAKVRVDDQRAFGPDLAPQRLAVQWIRRGRQDREAPVHGLSVRVVVKERQKQEALGHSGPQSVGRIDRDEFGTGMI